MPQCAFHYYLGVYQQCGGANGEAGRVQAHHHGFDAQHDVQGDGEGKEHQGITLRRREKLVKVAGKAFGSHRV